MRCCCLKGTSSPVSQSGALSSSLWVLSSSPAAMIIDNCFLCPTHEQQRSPAEGTRAVELRITITASKGHWLAPSRHLSPACV